MARKATPTSCQWKLNYWNAINYAEKKTNKFAQEIFAVF